MVAHALLLIRRERLPAWNSVGHLTLRVRKRNHELHRLLLRSALYPARNYYWATERFHGPDVLACPGSTFWVSEIGNSLVPPAHFTVRHDGDPCMRPLACPRCPATSSFSQPKPTPA